MYLDLEVMVDWPLSSIERGVEVLRGVGEVESR